VLTRIVSAILRDEHAVLTVSNFAPAQMNVGEEIGSYSPAAPADAGLFCLIRDFVIGKLLGV